jgi:hypothetical protein
VVWLIECLTRLEQGEGTFEKVSRFADVTHYAVEVSPGHQRLGRFVARVVFQKWR